MKRYLRMPKLRFYYRFDLTTFVYNAYANMDVVATEWQFDPNILPKEVWNKAVANYASFVDSVSSLLKSRGFHEVNAPHKSDSSISEYHLLCLENDFIDCKVEIFYYLRISDHPLPIRDDKKDPEEEQKEWADNTFRSKLRRYNPEVTDLLFEYEFAKYEAEDNGEPFDILPPDDFQIDVRYVPIDDIKKKSVARVMTEIDMALSDVKNELINRTRQARVDRAKYIETYGDDLGLTDNNG